MKRAFGAALLLAGCVTLSAQPSTPARPDGPWIGTWKRNAEKSKPTPRGEATFTMWVEGDGFRYTYEATSDQGPPTHMEAFGRFDGRPYPETGNPMADHNVFTRIDDRTYGLVDLKDGKETIRFTITISPDGRTRTSTARSRSAKGEEVVTIGVWDRVR
jgi:hypothetical protein